MTAVSGDARRAVAPATVDEVRDALADAAAEGLAVRTGGNGTEPDCLPPTRPFIDLSTLGLSRIEDYEPADLTVTAGAGTSLAALAEEVGSHGQWLPADPPAVARRTLGGLVATGAAGPLRLSYGAPRDQVLGLTLVTGDGRVLRLGGRVMKNVAGFDLVRLVVGSRGTLGVVVSVTVRLFPQPEEDRVLLVRAAGPRLLLGAAAVVATSAVTPASATILSPAPRGDGSVLAVRLQGARATVDAAEAHLVGQLACPVERLDAAASADLVAAQAEHATEGELLLRVGAFPTALPAILGGVHEAVPSAVLAADVRTGRIRAAVAAAGDTGPEALLALRSWAEELGGDLVLERAPVDVAEVVAPRADPSGAAHIAAALRARFDPGDVFVTREAM